MAGRPYDYVALQVINYEGARAYNPGDPVPADNVRRHRYLVGVQVAEYGSPEALEVTGHTRPDAPTVLDTAAPKAPAAKSAAPKGKR